MTEQLASGASGPLRLSHVELGMIVKSPATSMLETRRVSFPLFDSVTVCGALGVPIFCDGKFTRDGEMLILGTLSVPVPLNETESRSVLPPCNTLMVPEAGAALDGLNVTSIPQV